MICLWVKAWYNVIKQGHENILRNIKSNAEYLLYGLVHQTSDEKNVIFFQIA